METAITAITGARPYEGRLGIYNTHLKDLATQVDYPTLTQGLGSTWELMNVAVKPFPVCHFIHACGDAALALKQQHGFEVQDIVRVQALVAEPTLHIIAEPLENKRRPANEYDAKFSVHYFVAACLVRGQFGLAELEAASLTDTAILALAQKVEAVTDPDSGYPAILSAGVVITLSDGRELRHYERVNRGAGDRALTSHDIQEKFRANALLAVSPARAKAIQDAVYGLDQMTARGFGRALSAR